MRPWPIVVYTISIYIVRGNLLKLRNEKENDCTRFFFYFDFDFPCVS